MKKVHNLRMAASFLSVLAIASSASAQDKEIVNQLHSDLPQIAELNQDRSLISAFIEDNFDKLSVETVQALSNTLEFLVGKECDDVTEHGSEGQMESDMCIVE